MKNIQTDTRTVEEIFSDRKADFLVPDYQRAYSWTEEECQILLDDFCEFAFPGGNTTAFDADKSEYFLGVIVTFRNEKNQDELIDGQQRLTTLLLLMRAFYRILGGDSGECRSKTIDRLGECIWKADEVGELNKSSLKIKSEVIGENSKDELQKIIFTGTVTKNNRSNYAVNYNFFCKQLSWLKDELSNTVFPYLPARILQKCFFTRIRAESQDFALQMFSSLNNRGVPLSDTDIFKAVMYKFYNAQGDAENFIQKWKALGIRAEKTFGKVHHLNVKPIEFLFNCYSYRDIDKLGKNLRSSYNEDNYAVLCKPETLADLFSLMDFFDDLLRQNTLRFSNAAIRYAHILFRAKNSFIWLIMAHYFLCKRDESNRLDEKNFAEFLERLLAFLLAHSISFNNTSALRSYAFRILANLKNPITKGHTSYTFSADVIRSEMNLFGVNHQKKLMKSLVLNWWTFRDEEQPIPPIEKNFDVEHIFPKSLVEGFGNFTNKNNVNLLGNLALLEHGKNNNAASHRFADKRVVYIGFDKNGKWQHGTMNRELQRLAKTQSDFGEMDITKRNSQMIEEILAFVGKHDFL